MDYKTDDEDNVIINFPNSKIIPTNNPTVSFVTATPKEIQCCFSIIIMIIILVLLYTNVYKELVVVPFAEIW